MTTDLHAGGWAAKKDTMTKHPQLPFVAISNQVLDKGVFPGMRNNGEREPVIGLCLEFEVPLAPTTCGFLERMGSFCTGNSWVNDKFKGEFTKK